MKLQEFAAKQLLVQAGLPVPAWSVAATPAEARSQAEAYLAAGAEQGRHQGTGPRRWPGQGRWRQARCDRRTRRRPWPPRILGMDIKGITVRRVLVGPAADIVKEFYLAAVLDRTAQRIRMMGSAQGGVEIETVAETNPDAIVSVLAHPHLGLLDHQAREIAFAHGPR